MDANEYALKVQPAAKSLGMVIRKAEWLGNGAPRSERTAEIAVSREEDASADLPLAAAVEETAAKGDATDADAVALPTSPVPTLPPVPVEVGERDVTLTLGERRFQQPNPARHSGQSRKTRASIR